MWKEKHSAFCPFYSIYIYSIFSPSFMLKELWSLINNVNFIRTILYNIFFNSLYNNIHMRWKWQGAKGGSTRDWGSLQDQNRGFYITRLNSVSSQCARGKPSIARKPEYNPKIFNSLYNNIHMCWKWQGAKGGSTRDWGSLQDQNRGFYITRLNSVSSQCARGKPSIARKPEYNPKIFKW